MQRIKCGFNIHSVLNVQLIEFVNNSTNEDVAFSHGRQSLCQERGGDDRLATEDNMEADALTDALKNEKRRSPCGAKCATGWRAERAVNADPHSRGGRSASGTRACGPSRDDDDDDNDDGSDDDDDDDDADE
jgi:hypothetical protein